MRGYLLYANATSGVWRHRRVGDGYFAGEIRWISPASILPARIGLSLISTGTPHFKSNHAILRIGFVQEETTRTPGSLGGK